MTIPTQTSKNRAVRLSPMAGGTYTWRVPEDIVYADAVVAALFGIPAEEAERGLPLTRFLQAIHPEDLPAVAIAINAALESGKAYRAEYRVISASGTVAPIFAMGQCFRDHAGKPMEYSGMLFDLRPSTSQRWREEEMVESCIAAFQAAKAAGNEFVTYLLSMALIEIGQQTADNMTPGEIVH